jgi:hypothetical protein
MLKFFTSNRAGATANQAKQGILSGISMMYLLCNGTSGNGLHSLLI